MRSNGHPTCCEIASIKITGNPKVTKLDLTGLGQKQVTRLEIAVNDTMVVGVLQRGANLASHLSNDRPIKRTLYLLQPFDSSTIDELHDVKQRPRIFAAAVVADDMGMAQTLQNRHFTTESGTDQLILTNCGVKLFDCHLLPSCLLRGSINRANRPNAQDVAKLKFGTLPKRLHGWLNLHHLHIVPQWNTQTILCQTRSSGSDSTRVLNRHQRLGLNAGNLLDSNASMDLAMASSSSAILPASELLNVDFLVHLGSDDRRCNRCAINCWRTQLQSIVAAYGQNFFKG